MLEVAAALALTFVELHGPDNQRVFINPSEVASIREPRGLNQGHWAHGTHCLLIMADGKLITVTEDCDEVRKKIETVK